MMAAVNIMMRHHASGDATSSVSEIRAIVHPLVSGVRELITVMRPQSILEVFFAQQRTLTSWQRLTSESFIHGYGDHIKEYSLVVSGETQVLF
jgi:hypothetical protein